MKNRLLKLLAAKEARKAAITTTVETSTEVNEVRSAITEGEALNDEITELRAAIADLEAIEARGGAGTPPTAGRVLGTYGVGSGATGAQTQRSEDPTDSVEYRTAFMNFVRTGAPIPAELRANESTTLADIPAVIPTPVMNRILETLETVGTIYKMVTKTAFAYGTSIPISSVKPVATWVSEGATSDKQKKTTSGSVTFTGFKLRCEISMSAEAGAAALAIFETTFVKQISEAMIKAIEAKIVSNANGTTSCKGILAETPAAGQTITTDVLDYQLLCDTEAALPEAYEGGAVYAMTKQTFMKYVGMTDANGQPIARITYGITGKPERSLLGRQVVCGDYFDTFSDSLASGKVFAIIFNFEDYALNTLYDMGVQRQRDWDTEDMKTKGVMSVDGKVVDKGSLVVIKKK